MTEIQPPTGFPDTVHLLIDGPGEAARNMALDEALFRRACGEDRAILRLYSWTRPSITVGYFQDIKRHFDHEKIMKRGIPLVRRMTGGRGVLHDDELTYCFAVSSGLIAPFTKRAVFTFVNGLFMAAFRRLGVDARLKGRTDPREHLSGDCFRSVSEFEVAAAGGEKLIGSAQYISGSGAIQQGSIPLNSGTGAGIDEYLLQRSDPPPPGPRIDRAGFLEAFQAELKSTVKEVYLNAIPPDEDLVSALIVSRYASPDWTWRPESR
jgi:lipoate-protein ligase A